MRELELAGLVPVGAGEAPAHVPEQLRLEERFRQPAAVHGNEAQVGAGTVAVDAARDDFFADAALAGDENLRVGARHALDLLTQFHDLPADADQLCVRGLPRAARKCCSDGHYVGSAPSNCSSRRRCSAVSITKTAPARYWSPPRAFGSVDRCRISIVTASDREPTDARSSARSPIASSDFDPSSTPDRLTSSTFTGRETRKPRRRSVAGWTRVARRRSGLTSAICRFAVTMVICPSARKSPCSGRVLPAPARGDSSPKSAKIVRSTERRRPGVSPATGFRRQKSGWTLICQAGRSRPNAAHGAGHKRQACSCHSLTRRSRSICCDSERFTNSRPTRKRLACGASGTGETCRTMTVIGEVRCSKAS